jgi:hypothetical protein
MFNNSNNKKPLCPLLNKPCIEGQCAWWVTVRGYNPNTGKDVDQQQCTITTLPLLLIENSAQQRSTGAAVESMRNEVVRKAQDTNNILAHMMIPAQVSQLPAQSFIQLPQSNNG